MCCKSLSCKEKDLNKLGSNFNFNAIHININSLRSHIYLLKNYVLSNPLPHVIGISESKLSPTFEKDPRIELIDYELIRSDRSEFGGGVALYIHNSFKFELLYKNTTVWTADRTFPEYIIGEVYNKVNRVLVAVVYRPPHAPFLTGTSFIRDLITAMDGHNHKVIIGDFNADEITNKADFTFIRNFVKENSLQMIPYGNTYHYKSGDSALDLCLIDKFDKIISFSKTDHPFVNGHDLIQISIGIKPFKVEPKFIYTRDYNKLKKSNVLDLLNNVDWSELLADESVDHMLENFYVKYFEIIDSISPVKKVKVNNVHKGPWIDNLIKNLQYKTRHAYLDFVRNKTDYNYKKWKDLQYETAHKTELAYEAYQRFRILQTPSKDIHKELQNLGLIGKKSTSVINHTCEELNLAFAAVSNDDSIEPLDKVLIEIMNMQQPDVPVFEFRPITDSVIIKAVNSFTSNAVGVDNLNIRLLKLTLPSLLPFLKHLFNTSINNYEYPITFKKSIIVPINKVKNPKSTAEYRPISKQCCLAKVFDKIVYYQVESYVNERNLRDPHQSAYRPYHSTQTALIKLVSDIKRAMDDRYLSLIVSFDYSKCFDKISRRILIIYLFQMGFSIGFIRWLISYLSDRMQAIEKEYGSFTTWILTNLGLPQGSVLVTLFFPLYVLIVALEILFCKSSVFSDDRLIFKHFKKEDIGVVFDNVNQDIIRLKRWSNENSMILNLDKTEAIIIGHPRILNAIDCDTLPKLTDGVNVIKIKKSIKILGVVIDEHLNFKEQITKTCAKVHSKFYQLYNFRKITNKQTRIKLYNSIIAPIIDYALVVTMGISDELEIKLQRLANKGIRYIEGLPKDSHITEYRKNLKMLMIRDRRLYFALCIIYNAHHLQQPAYIFEYLQYNKLSRSARTAASRGCNTFVLPTFKTEFFKNAFPVEAVRCWNSLPIEITESSSIAIFKNKLKSFFLDNEMTAELQSHL